MANASGGIISGAMAQGSDPNAPAGSTAASSNPPTATSAPNPSTPSAGNNISAAPAQGSAADFASQLDSHAAGSAQANTTPGGETPANQGDSTTSNSGSTGIINGAMSQPTTQSAPTDYSSQISDLYQKDLGRTPDAAGLQFWEGQAQNGASMGDIDQAFRNSAEYKNDHAMGDLPKAETYTPNTLGTPTQVNVGPYQTVAGQLSNIMDPNNPIIMGARTQALQQANANGLLNSSMAITAGQDAAYKAAIPIAEQDATTYNNDAVTNAAAANKFAEDNQAALNSAGQFNAGAGNTLTGQELANQTSLTSAQIAAGASESNAQTAAGASEQNAQTQAASAQTVAQLNNTNTRNIQSASNVQQAAAQYQTALTNIANMNMDAESKYQADLNAFNAYKNAVSLLDQHLGVPDMSGQLQFNEVDPDAGKSTSTGTQP